MGAPTEDQIQEYREAFSLFDKKGNQTIASESIGDCLRALGQNPTQAQVKEIVKAVDPTGDKPVTFDEFLKILLRPDGFKPQGTAEAFVQGFQVFDKDSNGYISVGELRYVLTSLGEKLSESEVEEILKSFQPDKDGFVHYEEFVKHIIGA